jgi:hypothetical protein
MRFACCKTNATKTLGIFNTDCFPTGKVVIPTGLGVMFMRALPVLLLYLRLSFCASTIQEADM